MLFERLRLPVPPCATLLKHGGYRTGQDVLLELRQHPIARVVLEHRKLRALLDR